MKEGIICAVSHNFPKPGTADPVPKEANVTGVGNQGFGVGYFR